MLSACLEVYVGYHIRTIINLAFVEYSGEGKRGRLVLWVWGLGSARWSVVEYCGEWLSFCCNYGVGSPCIPTLS